MESKFWGFQVLCELKTNFRGKIFEASEEFQEVPTNNLN